MKPDVFGLNCATGPREMTEHLRHLSQHSAHADLGAPQRRPAVASCDGRTHYDLTPSELADHHRALRHRPRRARRRRVLRHHARAPRRRGRRAMPRPEPARRAPFLEPALSSIYSPVPIEQDTSFLIIGERTNANGSKAFREAMLAADWDTCVRMAERPDPRGRPRPRRVRRLRRPRRRGRHGRARRALRHPGQRAARARLHRAPRDGGRRFGTSAAARSSTPPTSRTAKRPGSRLDRVF